MTKISNLYTLTNYISANSSGNVVIAAPASGYALDVTGTGRFTGALTGTSIGLSSSVTASALYVTGMTAGSGAIYHTASRLTFANYNTSGTLHFEVNGGTGALTLNADTSASFVGSVGVATSPSGTYGKLTVAGGIRITNDNNAKLEIGRYSSGASNSYIKLGANSDSLRITNNTDLADIFTITNGGNVGIGTTDPQAILNGFSSSARGLAIENGYPVLAFSDTASSLYKFYVGTDSAEAYIWNAADGPIRFAANNTERMRITSEGNLLLTSGTTVYNTSGDFYLRAGTSGALILGAGGSNGYMRITSGGQIAIGTSNPQSGNNIQVNSTSPIFALYSGQTDTTTNLVYSTLMFKSYAGLYNQQFQQPDAQIQIVRGNHSYNGHQSTHDADMVFSTNDNVNGAGVTERMRITSTGFTKATSTGSVISSNGAYHEFRSDAANDPTLYLLNHNGSGDGLLVNLNTNGTSYSFFRGYSNAAGANRILIYSNGNIVNTNGSYGAISDIKLKENISDSTPKLADLLKVKVKNFNFIGSNDKQLGVIAQELEEVFPSMIDISPDRDAEGNDLGTVTKSVKYSVFVPILIKAIQELSAKVTALESK